MLVLISEGGGGHPQFFFPFKKEPFDWPMINIFGIWGTPEHRSLDKQRLPAPTGSLFFFFLNLISIN